MTQLWTIVAIADGIVLAPCFATPGYDSHPKDHGWDWDETGHDAIRIVVPPDPLSQVWNGASWVDDLHVLKMRRWVAVKLARDNAEQQGCGTELGRVDTDEDSQRKISGAVQMAMIAQAAGVPFALDWTMQNNSVVTHDAAAMTALGVAVGQHVAACHAEGSTRRVALADAADIDAIEAIAVDTGWPG